MLNLEAFGKTQTTPLLNLRANRVDLSVFEKVFSAKMQGGTVKALFALTVS